MLNFFKKRKGQVLLEATVAISMLSFGMVGLFSLLSNSFVLNKTSTNQYIAVNLAAEGIELVRNLIDTNIMAGQPWNSGISDGQKEVDYNDAALALSSSRFLKLDTNTGFYSYDLGTDTIFKRSILINNASDHEIRVKSIVDWNDRGGVPFTVSVEDRFFDWR